LGEVKGKTKLTRTKMNEYDVRRLALILAVQAEIEGMKADNKQREYNGNAMAYDETSFSEKAEELRNLAACHNEQL
jgi:hypothetical protein